jgi:tetratricopeptide (TPR) repeat protein
MANILRHQDPTKALAVYEHSLVRVRETKPSVESQRDEAALLVSSSYVIRWLGRENEAKQRLARAFELLQAAGRFPAAKVEPMSDSYDALRAQADDYAENGESPRAIDAYQQLLYKMMAWPPDLQNDLRDATCISRTWTALASLQRQAGRTEEAKRLEALRSELWNHWDEKLPNARFLLRQSLSQIVPPVGLHSVAKQ